MSPTRYSFALRSMVGFGLCGVFIAAVRPVLDTAVRFLGWPVSEVPFVASPAVLLLAYVVGSTIPGAMLIDRLHGWRRLVAAVMFGIILSLGYMACEVVFALQARPDSSISWLAHTLPDAIGEGIALGLAVGFAMLYLDHYLGIEGQHLSQVWVSAFYSFAFSGAVVFMLLVAPNTGPALSLHGLVDAPLTFALGGLLFGVSLDAIQRYCSRKPTLAKVS